MSRYIPMPDNDTAFYTYINLVINNYQNRVDLSKDYTMRPYNVGPVKVVYTRNEVGESFMVVQSVKDERFINRILDQFYCLRKYWSWVEEEVTYPGSSTY